MIDPSPSPPPRRRLLGLDRDRLRFVLDCLQCNTTQVRNIKLYYSSTIPIF